MKLSKVYRFNKTLHEKHFLNEKTLEVFLLGAGILVLQFKLPACLPAVLASHMALVPVPVVPYQLPINTSGQVQDGTNPSDPVPT